MALQVLKLNRILGFDKRSLFLPSNKFEGTIPIAKNG